MATTTDVSALIDELVADKTFSLDALDRVKAIKDANDKLVAELEDSRDTLARMNEYTAELVREKVSLNTTIDDLRAELVGLRETADKGQKAIYEADKERAVAFAYKSAMEIVFRPNAVRETVARNVSVAVPNGSGSGYVGQYPESGTVVREDL